MGGAPNISIGDRIIAFAVQARAASSRTLGSAFIEAVEPLGVGRYACLLLARRDGAWAVEKALSNLVGGHDALLCGEEAAEALLRLAPASGEFWSELPSTPQQVRVLRPVLRDFRQGEIFVRRVALDGGGQAVVLATGAAFTPTDPCRECLRWLTEILAREGARLSEFAPNGAAPPRKRLSGTQLKVLAMRTDGMSNQDIARVLGRKEKTIECHVTQILARLEARNMMDAARIAAAIALI